MVMQYSRGLEAGRSGWRLTAFAALLVLAGCAGGIDPAALPQSGFSLDDLPSSDTARASDKQRDKAAVKAAATPTGEKAPETASAVPAASAAAPSKGTAQLSEARQLRKAGDKAKALAVLDRAAESGAADPAVATERGLLALELGALDKARTLLQAATSADPSDWRAHLGLGTTLAAEGKHKDAQVAFAAALKIAPGHPSVLNNMALSLAMDGKHQEAEKLLRRAAETKDAKPHAKQNLALVQALRSGSDVKRNAVASAPSAVEPGKGARTAADASENAEPGSGRRPAEGTEPKQRAAGVTLPGDAGPILRLGGPLPTE